MQNKPFNMLCAVISIIICLNIFLVFAHFSVKRLKFVLKWSISYFQPDLASIFVTITTVKGNLIPDFYTWAILLIN